MDKTCAVDFTDQTKNIAACRIHPFEKWVLRPDTRDEIIANLVSQGKWAGEQPMLTEQKEKPLKLTPKPEVTARPVEKQTPPPQPAAQLPSTLNHNELVEYETPEGQQVAISLQFFADCVCPQTKGKPQFAAYMMGWCKHNRIDPLSGEAYFSVMKEAEKDRDGNKTGVWLEKPVIMVSRDCWVRRMDRHPALEWHDGGLVVEVSMKRLQAAVIGGMGDDYLVPQAVKEKLLELALSGKASASLSPDAEGRILVRKRGQLVGEGERLDGAWYQIKRKDRPTPLLTEINLEGWKKESPFWKSMEPWMIFKTAQKNAIRMAMPELSGLVTAQEPDTIDAADAADRELHIEHSQLSTLRRRLFGIGQTVPLPVGPLEYPQLHALSKENFDGKGISELSGSELQAFVDLIQRAADGEQDVLDGIQSDLQGGTHGQAQTNDDTRTAHIFEAEYEPLPGDVA